MNSNGFEIVTGIHQRTRRKQQKEQGTKEENRQQQDEFHTCWCKKMTRFFPKACVT